MIEGKGFVFGALVGVVLAAALILGVVGSTGGSSFHVNLVQPGTTGGTSSSLGSQSTPGDGWATAESGPVATITTSSTASSNSFSPVPSSGTQANTSTTSVSAEMSLSSPSNPPSSASGGSSPARSLPPVAPSSVSNLSSETGYSVARLILPLAVGFALGGVFYGLYRRRSEEETQGEAPRG